MEAQRKSRGVGHFTLKLGALKAIDLGGHYKDSYDIANLTLCPVHVVLFLFTNVLN